MYSKHKCLSWIVDERKPAMHSSRNSSVRYGSLEASFSLMLFMNMVLLDGMQRPLLSSSWPSMRKSNVWARAHRRLYAADLRFGSLEPRFSKAMLSSVPGTSFGLFKLEIKLSFHIVKYINFE